VHDNYSTLKLYFKQAELKKTFFAAGDNRKSILTSNRVCSNH